MKKYFNNLLAAFALVALSVACNKVNPVNDGNPSDPSASSQKIITISATLTDAATRVTFDPAFDNGNKPTGMSHTWEDGDKLRVADASDDTNFKVYDLVDGAGTSEGVFRGEVVVAESYNVEAIPLGEFETGTRQTQARDGATGHLRYVAAATGVTDLTQIELTETSGIIGIIAKLPARAAATINLLTIETSTDDFVTKKTIAIALTTQQDVDADDILTIYANVPSGWTIAAGTKMFLKFGSTNANHTVYTRYQEFASAAAPVEGKFNYIKLNCSNIDKYAGGSDAGTEAAPYLIADPYQLKAVNDLLNSEIRYFKLISDIDMDGVSWTNINPSTPYKPLDFDGNNKTISNLGNSMFYVFFKSSIKNLTLEHCKATNGTQRGIFAQYVQGNGGHTITNVDISNGEVQVGNGNMGGLIGRINNPSGGTTTATITDCDVSNTAVTGKSTGTGGLIGSVESVVTVSNCRDTCKFPCLI